MKARGIILAAGRGSRMNGHTAQRPKCLIEVGGKALLHWQLDAMRAAGIDAIGIVTGYQREQLDHADLREFHNARWGTTNMVSSLECARDWLESGTCIVSYSDIFYASSAIASQLACEHALAIAYDPNWRALWERRFADPLCD